MDIPRFYTGFASKRGLEIARCQGAFLLFDDIYKDDLLSRGGEEEIDHPDLNFSAPRLGLQREESRLMP